MTHGTLEAHLTLLFIAGILGMFASWILSSISTRPITSWMSCLLLVRLKDPYLIVALGGEPFPLTFPSLPRRAPRAKQEGVVQGDRGAGSHGGEREERD